LRKYREESIAIGIRENQREAEARAAKDTFQNFPP